MLDLILVNKEDLVDDIQYDSHIGESDHITINFEINISDLCIKHQQINKTVYKYHSTDIDQMNKIMDTNWEQEFQHKYVIT